MDVQYIVFITVIPLIASFTIPSIYLRDSCVLPFSLLPFPTHLSSSCHSTGINLFPNIMELSRKAGLQFSIPVSDWLLTIVSYMMINLAQVSPPRQQVRIDGIQEDYPSSWAGGTLSEFGKSVPNQGPAVLGRVRSAVWEALLEINGKHSRSMYC